MKDVQKLLSLAKKGLKYRERMINYIEDNRGTDKAVHAQKKLDEETEELTLIFEELQERIEELASQDRKIVSVASDMNAIAKDLKEEIYNDNYSYEEFHKLWNSKMIEFEKKEKETKKSVKKELELV